jgi:hypothetical protein
VTEIVTDVSADLAVGVPRQRGVGAQSSVDRAARSSPVLLVLRALPWAVVVAALLAAMVWTSTPEKQILRYAAYWVIGVAVPGTLVFRALRGSRGNLPEDVGFGAVTGFAVQLVGWALFVGAGLGGWLRVWPLLVIGLFVAVPGLRRHWSLRSAEPMRLAASWAIAGVMLAALATLAFTWWGANPLPPTAHSLFGDIYYHWANAAELRRTITPQQPQQAGDPLIYHWFSDAYRASASMLSGVPLSTVMLRLWIGPVVLTGALVIAAVGRHVSRVWWAGPVAAFVAVAVPAAWIWPAYVSGSFSVLPIYSPTMVFSIPVMAVVVFLLVDVARGVPLGRAWVLFAAMLLLATASKSSSLPVLFGGICLATAASWIIHRRPPRMLLATVVAVLATLAVTAPTLAGGEAGASIQLGAWFTFQPDFTWLTTGSFIPGTGGLLPTPWWHQPAVTRFALFALILCLLVGQLGRLAGFAALLHRRTRGDVAAWLLAGMGFAGWGGALLINHVNNGEGYFLSSAIPALSVLTAWLLAAVAPGRRRALIVLGGIGAGWVTGAFLQRFGPGGGKLDGRIVNGSNPGGSRELWLAHWRYDLLTPVAALAVVVAVGVLAWWAARRRWRAVLAGAGVAVLVGGAVGLGGDTTYRGVQSSVQAVADGKLPTGGLQGRFWVTSGEMRAAQWLARHAPTGDIVATNVHCEGVKTPTAQPCVNRSFWVSAMTEHAVVIEGWAYQPETMARHGVNGLPSYLQPAPDSARLRINDAVFTDPTPEGLAELAKKYHAKWLFADTRASAVSATLGTLATVRYRSGTVTIYQLDD